MSSVGGGDASGGRDRSDTVVWLQRDLRALGYLAGGLDGSFGEATARAIRALKIDLVLNDGNSRGGDGPAPVKVRNYARGRAVTPGDTVDAVLIAIIAEMIGDPAFPKIPSSEDPAGENTQAMATLAQLSGVGVPMPFLFAMMLQESGRRHFNVPKSGGLDAFLLMGLDRNDDERPDRITSRGYGIGQYTLFHHPARPEEIAALIRDPVHNISRAIAEFAEKFGRFVVGPDDRADDRTAENPLLRLRLCRYVKGDARYMTDCRACARAARPVTIRAGVPLYPGSNQTYRATPYYPSADYGSVPDRSDFGCDWPYAARRYNGSGINSFHYQVRVLRNLFLGA
ncbi:MAG TPA: peptidoglycan-binding domain-containing protein [Kaistia sp.]|nr:peptidoglycan-binding domain-containing protein [Kaistia sp.]